MILAAERQARATLWDLGAEHAEARLRSIGEVAEAAIEVWQELAVNQHQLTDPPTDPPPDPTLDHFIGLTQGLKRTQQRGIWPEPGPGDRHLERVADLLTRAAALMRAGLRPARLQGEPGQGAHLIRLQVAQVVMVSAHAVHADLAAYANPIQPYRVRGRPKAAQRQRQAAPYREHVAGIERYALDYVDGRWLDPQLGATRVPADPARLETALAGFDRRAHKVLAYGPTVADLYLISHLHQEHAVVTGIVTTAATYHQPAERIQVERGLLPALHSLEGVLGHLATDLQLLAANKTPADRGLLEAARELQSAMLDITSPLGRNSSPQEMATRVPFDHTATILTRHLASTASMAHSIRENVSNPNLTAPARGIKALIDRINHDFAATRDQDPRDPRWRARYNLDLDPRDLLHNKAVHPPAIVTATLLRTSYDLAAAATIANAAGAAVRPASQARAGQASLQGATRLDGRREQDRAVAPEVGPDLPRTR